MSNFKLYLKSLGTDGDLPLWSDRRELYLDWLNQEASPDQLDSILAEKGVGMDERQFCTLSSVYDQIRYQDFRPRKQYHLQENFLEVDQYVNQVYNEYFPEKKEYTKDWTRSGKMSIMWHSLLKYANPLTTKESLCKNQKMFTLYNNNLNELEKMWLNANNGDKYNIISLNETLQHIPLNTSAGYNHIGKKKQEVVSLALRNAFKMKWRIERNRFQNKLPCTLAMRGHLSEKKLNKTRPVWVTPFETVLLECTMFYNFYKVLKADQGKIPFITGDGSMHRLWNYINNHPDHDFCSVDISAWDTMRGKFLIYDVMNVLKRCINITTIEEERLFNWILHDMVETQFILPSGLVFEKTSGIPSGTYLTLLINSCINWVVQKSTLEYIGLQWTDLSVLGDDNSFKTKNMDEHHIKQLAQLELELFGLLIHPDKFELYKKGQPRKFLGYEFRNLRLYRKEEDWFRLALLPEREVKDLATSFTRVFSYLLIGGINNPNYVIFFEKYINIYYDKLKDISYMKKQIFTTGSLRIFKHALNLDLEFLANINIDKLLKFNFFMMPFFFACNYDIGLT